MTKPPVPIPARRKTIVPQRLVARAVAVLAFERLWPTAVLLACCFGLFFAASWLGLWLDLPSWGHILGLLLFAAVLLASLASLRGVRWPDRAAALARLDRDSGLPHRPISTAEDRLANGVDDASTRALWDLHRKRLGASIARAQVRAPSPRVPQRDRFALRCAILLAAVAAGFVAGPEKYGRLAAAFSWGESGTAAGTRVDAWIDPPGYTGKPPLVLVGQGRADETHGPVAFSAPAGSSVVVRAAGAETVEIVGTGALRTAPAKAGDRPAAPASLERRFTLSGDGELRIARAGQRPQVFRLHAVPDVPPRIRLAGPPKANARGTLALAYVIEDDYGVTGAEAHFANPVVNGRTVTGRALVEPPHGPLTLPPMPGGLGEGKTTLDLPTIPGPAPK